MFYRDGPQLILKNLFKHTCITYVKYNFREIHEPVFFLPKDSGSTISNMKAI